MGENYVDLFFYTRQQEELYNPRQFQQLVDGLVALNFYVALPSEEIDQQALTASSISPAIETALREAQEATRYTWMVQIYSLDQSEPFGGFTFVLGNIEVDEDDEVYGSLDLEYLERLFDGPTNGVAMYEHFLQAIRLVYEVYHPIYGYQFDGRDGRAITTREEALTLQIHTLYDINLFGPELVEKLGRQRVESAQAQKVIPLDDGGMMLVPRIFFSPDLLLRDCRKLADDLGLSYPI